MSSDCQDDDELCAWCKKPRHTEPCAGMLEYKPKPHDWPAPVEYEAVFKSFKAHARSMPNASAKQIARDVADALGVSVQTVVEACAVVHSMNAARGEFEKNER